MDEGTSVIPACDRIAKLPAVPRFTAAGPAARAAMGTVRPSTMKMKNAVTVSIKFL